MDDRQWLALGVLMLLTVALTGCFGGSRGGPPADAPGTPSSGNPAVEVMGAMRKENGSWLVDVQANNVGATTLGYAQPYCQGTAWFALLAGPPGTNLTYRDPAANQLGCPAINHGRFEPGSWQNWTADPTCNTYYVCDNQWDGRIWDHGQSEEAPEGTYTWTFIFPYHDRPEDADGQGGPALRPGGRHEQELEFEVQITR